jgi:hypothetical protein
LKNEKILGKMNKIYQATTELQKANRFTAKVASRIVKNASQEEQVFTSGRKEII